MIPLIFRPRFYPLLPIDIEEARFAFSRPILDLIKTRLPPGRLSEEIARDLVKSIRGHFLSLPSNEREFPTTHFWRRAAESTRYEVKSDGVRISISQVGVRQRFLGGDINSVRAKFLTIPAIAETYGHRAADFSDLKIVHGFFGMYNGGVATLALVPADWTKEKSGNLESSGVYFWLLEHVSQGPNPDVLPSNDEIIEVIVRAANRLLDDKSHNN